ncbi:MAG TPA: peptidylprolyl isomerase [Chitinophagaceae bacterium]|nr:peptidylprolyl isomerase [Chitinophagaceae bacterium]
MSVIQTIRDKYARWAVIAIAVALTGFILMDAFTGRSRLFSGANSTTLGRVNGKSIDEMDFEKKVQAQEQNMQQQKGGSLGESDRQQIINDLWKEEVDQILLKNEFDKLGLSIGKKERTDMLYGPDPQQLARQYLGDPQTGQYDPNRAQQIINAVRRGKDKAQKDNLNLLLDAIDNARLGEKYVSLIAGSIHYPKWALEKQNADNSLIAKISYVRVPDSLITNLEKATEVSDKEIADYVNKHKDIYKTDDESRTIEYVLFSAAPNSADSADVRSKLLSLKPLFDTVKNMDDFAKANSEIPYYNSYISKKTIQVPAKDSIFKTPVGGIYGPFVDKGNYVLAKVMDVKELPDTVKVRHILIATQQQQQGQMVQVREDSTAKKLADSIGLAIKNGANFDTLCRKYTDDSGTKDSGIYNNVYTGQMVPEFNDFIFTHKVGESGVVKTVFGYHYIQILSQKGSEPAYKIAYLSKKIEASDETERNAENAATQFAGDSRDQKSFDANFDKNLKSKGLQKLFAPDINSHAFQIPGIGASRKFIKEVFDADKGDVLQPERVGDNYVVAVVTEVNKAGVLSTSVARRYIEPILRNQKKSQLLKKKIGKVTTLEALAASIKQPIQTADSLRFSGGNNPIAYELKVVGAAFNPANKGKVVPEPIDGRYGSVYAIRVDNVSATAVENADVNAQAKSLAAQGRMSVLMSNQYAQLGYGQQYDPAAVLRKAATIRDNRNKFY